MEGLLRTRIPRDTIRHLSSLTGLAEKRVKKICKTQNIRNYYDAYLVFDHAKKNGLYAHFPSKDQDITCMRSLACLDWEPVATPADLEALTSELRLLTYAIWNIANSHHHHHQHPGPRTSYGNLRRRCQEQDHKEYGS